MKGKRVKVILNSDRKGDQRILDYLYCAGMPNSRAIKAAVLVYLDGERDDTDRFLQQVKEDVGEGVQGLQLTPMKESSMAGSVGVDDEEPVSMRDFLDALESGPFSEENGPSFSA